MSTHLHLPTEIADFLGTGETRLIAAAYRDPTKAGELFILEDGHAERLRAWTREHLQCFVPGCPDPRLTTVSRHERRDGFTHHKGAGGHSEESVAHLQGKAIVARWLRRHLPSNAVRVEAATDTQRHRVADVLAVLPDGTRVAFEIQYADITVAEWAARHESYRAQGIVDVWLWGHTRLHARRHSDDEFRLDTVQTEVTRTGSPGSRSRQTPGPKGWFSRIAETSSSWSRRSARRGRTA